MKVFVTGATGFVGSAVCRALLKEGHEVHGLTSKLEKSELLQERGIIPLVGDMRDASVVSPKADECDITIMCAQLSFGSRFTKAKLKEFAEAEILHVKGVVEGAKKRKRKVIYTAGYIILGINDDGWSDEECGFDPPEFSKGGTEAAKYLLRQVEKKDITGCVLLPGFVYGPDGFFAEIATQIKSGKMRLPGGGNFYWSPVYIEDLAQAYIAALGNKSNGRVILAVDDKPMLMRDLMHALADELKVKRPGNVPKFMASIFMGSAMIDGMTTSRKSKNDLAKDLLGWEPKFSTYLEGLPTVVKKMNA